MKVLYLNYVDYISNVELFLNTIQLNFFGNKKNLQIQLKYFHREQIIQSSIKIHIH